MKFVGNIASDSEVVATADGAITAGKPVVVNADGTVKFAGQETATQAVGSNVVFNTGESTDTSTAFDSTNNKVVITYCDQGNSNYGTAIVGTVDSSDNSISFGSESVFESAFATQSQAVFDSSNEKIVIAYEDHGNSNYGTAVVGTISGTSISFGTPAVFESADISAQVGIRAVFDSSNNKVVILYSDGGNSNYGTAIVGTVSGTSISFGSAALFESASSQWLGATFDSSNNKVVVVYRDGGNSNYGTAAVGTVSGTSISFGTPVVYESATSEKNTATFDSSNNKVVIVYQDQGNSNYGTAIVGTVSGTSISFGSAAVFESAEVDKMSATFDTNVNKVIISYRDNGNSNYGTVISGTVSGTSISFDTPIVFQSDTAGTLIGSAFDSNVNRVVISTRRNSDSYGTATVYRTGGLINSLTSENFIGFAKDNVADGAVATIQTANSIARDNISEPTSFTYNSQSFDLSGQSITTPEEIRFKPDGTKFYILSGGDDTVYQYSMSTAWDISTASYESKSFSVSSQEGNPQGLAINADGTSIYVCGQTKSIYQYDLSTAYDASTASYASKSFSFSTQLGSNNPWSIDFNDTGTILYMISTVGVIYQYTLSTAFDISTASYASKSFDTTSQTTETTGIAVTSDGTGVYVVNYPNDTVFKYTLSTPFDIATASYSNISFTTTSQDTFPYGVGVKTDDTQVYITGSTNDSIFQYSVSTSLTIGQTYFVQTDGTLSTSADSPSVIAGTAISSTDLIVKG